MDSLSSLFGGGLRGYEPDLLLDYLFLSESELKLLCTFVLKYLFLYPLLIALIPERLFAMKFFNGRLGRIFEPIPVIGFRIDRFIGRLWYTDGYLRGPIYGLAGFPLWGIAAYYKHRKNLYQVVNGDGTTEAGFRGYYGDEVEKVAKGKDKDRVLLGVTPSFYSMWYCSYFWGNFPVYQFGLPSITALGVCGDAYGSWKGK